MNEKAKKNGKTPGFWEGFASIFGYSQPIDNDVNDWEALRGDWERVGNDIRVAMNKFSSL